MIFHHTGSKDAYITDKIIADTSRATGANTGYSSTIDLFKLYNESQLPDTSGNIVEKSRGLLYFNLTALKTKLTSEYGAGILTHSSTKIKLVLSDVQGTQVAPTSFTLQLHPLNQAFDEGIGDNIVTFGDLQATNWLSGSLSVKWRDDSLTGGSSGEVQGGWYNSTAIGKDSDNNLYQTFTTGDENLEMDITTWVQAHWADSSGTPNYGWILKYTDAIEADAKSYFVKRFATRHSRNVVLRPKLVISWTDAHQDSRLDFEAGTTNIISIRNYVNGVATALTETPALTLSYGSSWTKTNATITNSAIAGVTQVGMYQAAISAIDIYGSDSAIAADLIASGSLLIQEKWTIDSGAQIVHTGSFSMKNPLSLSSGHARDLRFTLIDLKAKYTANENPIIRLFVRDKNLANESVRIPIQLASQKVTTAYYQIKDANSNLILVPFSYDNTPTSESTRVSSDARGMYFSFPTSILPRGRTYTIDILCIDRGERRIYEMNQAFRVQ